MQQRACLPVPLLRLQQHDPVRCVVANSSPRGTPRAAFIRNTGFASKYAALRLTTACL